jgi:DNA excision repair protein ERCC-4
MITVYHDNNEQLPYSFNKEKITLVKKYLDTGDYTLHGAEDTICIERKSLDDYVSSLQKDAFFKEVDRMKMFPIRYIIVEGNISQILDRKHSSNVPASEILEKTLFIMLNSGVPVLFFENRQIAIYFLENLFLQYGHKQQTTKGKSPKGSSPTPRKRKNTKTIL